MKTFIVNVQIDWQTWIDLTVAATSQRDAWTQAATHGVVYSVTEVQS